MPSPADALWNEAQIALNTHQHRKAQNIFDDFIKRNARDPRVASARVYIGICEYRHGGKTQRALDVWNRTVSMELLQKRSSPALLLALEQLAGHYRSENRTDDLKKTLASFWTSFPMIPLQLAKYLSLPDNVLKAGTGAGPRMRLCR